MIFEDQGVGPIGAPQLGGIVPGAVEPAGNAAPAR